MPRHRPKRRADHTHRQAPSTPRRSQAQHVFYQYPFQSGNVPWYMVPTPWAGTPVTWGPPAPWPFTAAPTAVAGPSTPASTATPTAVAVPSTAAPTGAVPTTPSTDADREAVIQHPVYARQEAASERVLTPAPTSPCPVIIISDDEDEFPAEEVVIPDGTLCEDFCTICIMNFHEGTSYIGILNDCSCYKYSTYCFCCAVQLKEMGLKCPRCRAEIMSVTSQVFKRALLHPNFESSRM